MNISDKELELIMKFFLSLKEYLPNARIAENNKEQVTKMVNESLSILRKVRDNSPKSMGGSVTDKTKQLFDMFGLDERIKR